MDFIFSLLAELFVAGCEKGSIDKRLPGKMRIILGVIFCMLYLFGIGFVIFFITWLYKRNLFTGVVIALVGLVLFMLESMSFIKKFIKSNRNLE